MSKIFKKFTLVIICIVFCVLLYGCRKDDNDELSDSNTILFERYSITYYVDGDIYWKKTYKVGSAIEEITAPTKEGYTFVGWDQDLPKVMGKENIVVNAEYEINEYTIIYYLDGDVYKKQKYNYNEIIDELEPEFNSDEYYFSGWSNISEKMPSSDLEVHGYLYKKDTVQLIDLTELENNTLYNITKSGTYIVSGKNTNVGINVEGSNLAVELLLNNIELKNNNLYPINSIGNDLSIILLNDTENTLVYTNKKNNGGCINVNANLSINGSGSIKIESTYDGIYASGSVAITSANLDICSQEVGINALGNVNLKSALLKVSSLADGISTNILSALNSTVAIDSGSEGIVSVNDVEFNDCLVEVLSNKNAIFSNENILINGGSLTVDSQMTGIMSLNNVLIQKAVISIVSLYDGIYSEGNVEFSKNPQVNIISGGGLNGEFLYDKNNEKISCKGIYALNNIEINSGYITIESLDNSIKANKEFIVNGGTLEIKTRDGR